MLKATFNLDKLFIGEIVITTERLYQTLLILLIFLAGPLLFLSQLQFIQRLKLRNVHLVSINNGTVIFPSIHVVKTILLQKRKTGTYGVRIPLVFIPLVKEARGKGEAKASPQ